MTVSSTATIDWSGHRETVVSGKAQMNAHSHTSRCPSQAASPRGAGSHRKPATGSGTRTVPNGQSKPPQWVSRESTASRMSNTTTEAVMSLLGLVSMGWGFLPCGCEAPGLHRPAVKRAEGAISRSSESRLAVANCAHASSHKAPWESNPEQRLASGRRQELVSPSVPDVRLNFVFSTRRGHRFKWPALSYTARASNSIAP